MRARADESKMESNKNKIELVEKLKSDVRNYPDNHVIAVNI